MSKASTPSSTERAARQADALRRNLARRKQQARDRAEQGEPPPEETAVEPAGESER